MKRIFLLTVVVFFLSPWLGNGQEKKLQPFMVAYSSVTANRAPLWIAHDTGLFEKYGLDVKFINIAAGNVALSALLTAEVHLVTAAGPQVVAAVAQGAPITIVSTNGGSLFQLVARPSIKTLQDLRGKVIGSSRIGAGTDFVLRRILDKLGLVPGKDVSLIPTGLSESEKRIVIMLQGKLDATLGEPDKVFQFVEMKGEKMSVLGDLRDFGIPVPGSELVATRHFLKDQRGRLKNFLMAYSEAISLGRGNKELVHQTFKKYLRIGEPKLLDFTYRVQFLESIPAKPYPREDAVQVAMEDLAPTIPKLREMKVGDFIDAGPMKEIEDDGFFARLQK
jgi:ABC-type nitrate/sulfonate/bicarbonate transport system substrate-binding protein